MRLSSLGLFLFFLVSASLMGMATGENAHAFGKKKSYSAQKYNYESGKSADEYAANLDSADDQLNYLNGIKGNEDEYKKYSKDAKEEIDKEIRNLIAYKGKLKEGIAQIQAEEKKKKEEELAAAAAENEALRLQNALLQQAATYSSTTTTSTDTTTSTKSDDPSAPPVETSAKLSPDTGAIQNSAKISVERAPASVESIGAM
jgi:hypothetical protein